MRTRISFLWKAAASWTPSKWYKKNQAKKISEVVLDDVGHATILSFGPCADCMFRERRKMLHCHRVSRKAKWVCYSQWAILASFLV